VARSSAGADDRISAARHCAPQATRSFMVAMQVSGEQSDAAHAQLSVAQPAGRGLHA